MDSMSDTSAVVPVGSVQLGQQKDVYVALQIPEGADPTKQYLEAEFSYQHQVPQKVHTATAVQFRSSARDPLVQYCWCRLQLITGIFEAIDAVPDLKEANEIVAK